MGNASMGNASMGTMLSASLVLVLLLQFSEDTIGYRAAGRAQLGALRRATMMSLDHGTLLSLKPRSPPSQASSRPPQQPDYDQSEAIVSTEAAVLVVAGPGSGKTRVLSARLAYLLKSGACNPSEILVLSFTNSAANNLCAKASTMLKDTVATTSGVQCDTFHGFCSSVIRKHMPLLGGAQKVPVIADDADQMRIMMEILAKKGKPHSKRDAQDVLRLIREWKELGLGYFAVQEKFLDKPEKKMAYEMYPEYQARLKMLNALDFGDLLLQTLRLFREKPGVLEMIRRRFQHVLVDEFQDVSPAQYDILKMLVLGSKSSSGASLALQRTPELPQFSSSLSTSYPASSPSLAPSSSASYPHTIKVFCAGDDDQSIYSWRGADVELMKKFRYDFPGSHVHRFQVSYRMPESLRFASNHIVASMPGRISKDMKSIETGTRGDRDADAVVSAKDLKMGSKPIHVRRNTDEEQELQWIAQYLQEKRSELSAPFVIRPDPSSSKSLVERAWSSSLASTSASASASVADSEADPISIAVLARTAAEVTRIADALSINQVPFRSRGSGAWVLPEGGDAPLSLLRLIALPDDDVAFEVALDNDIIRASLTREEVVGPIMSAVRLAALRKHTSLLAAARECVLTGKLDKLGEGAAPGMGRFLKAFDGWRSDYKRTFRRGEAGKAWISKVLKAAYMSVGGGEGNKNIERSIVELSRSASCFDSLDKFFGVLRNDGDYVVEDASGQRVAHEDQTAEDLEMIELWANASGGAHMVEGEHTKPIVAKNDPVSVWVMTMHAAKGLEFDEVILPFWTDGNMPRDNSPEERRVAFVSLTRARKNIRISYSLQKHKDGTAQPQRRSVLLDELMGLTESIIHYEDASTIQRLMEDAQKMASRRDPPLQQYFFPPGQVGKMSGGGGGERSQGEVAFHPSLSKEFVDVVTGHVSAAALGAAPTPSTVAAAPKKLRKRAAPGTPKTPRASAKKTPRAPVAPLEPLPAAKDLTVREINRLVFDSKQRVTSVKELLREGLANMGVIRGTIDIDSEGTTKAISKATVAELGRALIELIQKNDRL